MVSLITGFGRLVAGTSLPIPSHHWFWNPTRIIPCDITYLQNPEWAVEEIHRNAERGFVSVTFPERPHAVGMPNL